MHTDIERETEKIALSTRSASSREGGDFFRALLPQLYLPIVLAAIVAIGYLVTPNFLSMRNFGNVISFSSIIAILAIGQFYVILTGGIDLSVGANLALSTVVAALTLQTGMDAGLSTVITLLACTAVGFGNGLLVVWLRIPPFIATLAMMTMVQGFSYIIQSTSLIQIENETFVTWFADGSILGIANPVFIFLLATVIASFVSRYTSFGRRLYAIGGNREAARLSGLPVARDLFITYSISGFLAGLAGLLAAAQLLQGSSLVGRGYELDAIAAVVVGGASLVGGNGNPLSTVIGVFVLATIVNIMNLVGISSEPQLVIKGAVIVLAVFLSSAGGIDRISGAFRRLRSHVAGGS